jgi:hypothetical protein
MPRHDTIIVATTDAWSNDHCDVIDRAQIDRVQPTEMDAAVKGGLC